MFNLVSEKLKAINYSSKSFSSKIVNGAMISSINSVVDFIQLFVDLDSGKTKIVETTSYQDIIDIKEDRIQNIVNFTWLNKVSYLNKFLEEVNNKLPLNGILICRLETKEQRYRRIFNKLPKFVFYPYYSIDFIINRLFPKLAPTRYIYKFLTKGNIAVISLAHILGMFVFYGFKINYLKDINDITHFVLEKIGESNKNSMPSSGIIFKMKRIGLNGKIIHIYKLRTMHPYSEYIQDFIYNLNGSGNGDKITDDFRIASWGKFLRKYWLDELPMLLNFLKGDVKLVGVRPLSYVKFNLYPLDLQKLRISTKPGLIPPFYADLPKTFEELLESERKYLLAYKQNPIKTDIKYFFNCWFNIIIKKARSA